MRIYRIVAHILLLTFVLNLGDWPFIDEILAEQTQQQNVANDSAPSGTRLVSALNDKSTNLNHSSGSIYQTLTDLVDMPKHNLMSAATSDDRPSGRAEAQLFVSADIFPLERPPSFSLI